MMLTEEQQVPAEALPVAQLKDHLRLSTGFDTDTVQDALLESFLRAALAGIEARVSKALYERDFHWELSRWRDGVEEVFPIGPVTALGEVTLIDRNGGEVVLPVGTVRLDPDLHFPVLRSTSGILPPVPSGGQVKVGFSAGFGPAWSDIPADLSQAVLLLASHYYEYRNEVALADGCMPFGVTSLIERYRAMRLGLRGRL